MKRVTNLTKSTVTTTFFRGDLIMKRVTTLLVPAFAFVVCLLVAAGLAQATLIAQFGMQESAGPLVDQIGGYTASEVSDPYEGDHFLYQQSGVPAGTYGAITLSSGPVHSATITTGGSNEYWQIDSAGSKAINLVNNFTAMAWINYNNDWYDTVVGAALGGWAFGVAPVADPTLVPYSGVYLKNEGFTATFAGTPLSAGWHNIAATKSSTSGITFYVDGVQVGQDSSVTSDFYAMTVSSSAYFTLGGGDAANWFLNGANVADVRVYNTVLTASDIASAAGSVPEPGAMVLLTTAAVGLLAYAWRKRR